jgi:hypothetical protein
MRLTRTSPSNIPLGHGRVPHRADPPSFLQRSRRPPGARYAVPPQSGEELAAATTHVQKPAAEEIRPPVPLNEIVMIRSRDAPKNPPELDPPSTLSLPCSPASRSASRPPSMASRPEPPLAVSAPPHPKRWSRPPEPIKVSLPPDLGKHFGRLLLACLATPSRRSLPSRPTMKSHPRPPSILFPSASPSNVSRNADPTTSSMPTRMRPSRRRCRSRDRP